jgi:hypothetical protein
MLPEIVTANSNHSPDGTHAIRGRSVIFDSAYLLDGTAPAPQTVQDQL